MEWELNMRYDYMKFGGLLKEKNRQRIIKKEQLLRPGKLNSELQKERSGLMTMIVTKANPAMGRD